MPRGGPSGGDGGNGGSVILVADPSLAHAARLALPQHYRAPHGEHGRGKDQYGADGRGPELARARRHRRARRRQRRGAGRPRRPRRSVVSPRAARAGAATSTSPRRRTRRRATPSRARRAQERQLRLELKLLADVGLLGYPNAGKSTFISRVVARARPKIADYPFTTLVPNLGVVGLRTSAAS